MRNEYSGYGDCLGDGAGLWNRGGDGRRSAGYLSLDGSGRGQSSADYDGYGFDGAGHGAGRGDHHGDGDDCSYD